MSEITNYTGVPDKNIEITGHIQGWVDVVGFKNMVREDGIDYVPSNPLDHTIVKYDATAYGLCGACGASSINTELNLSLINNNITATLKVNLRWYRVRTVCSDKSCYQTRSYYTEIASFQDTEPAPRIYQNISNSSVYITEYNNTIAPKTSITVTEPNNISKLTIRYGNNVSEHYLKTSRIEYTDKQIPFANISHTDFWKTEGQNISRIGNHVLFNSLKLDYKSVSVSVSSPYETVYASNYSIQRVDYTPEKTWSPLLFLFSGVVAIIITGTKKLYRRVR